MIQTKTCTKCLQEKTLDLFYRKQDGKLGCRAQCKTCVDERNRSRYVNVLSKDHDFMARNRARGIAWYNNNRARSSARIAKTHRQQREACLKHYGPSCQCCGESTYEFLSIDHINGGGVKHRKTGVSKICRWLISNGMPEGFRVLCHNCNQAIGFHGTCPHQSAKT